MSHISVIVDSTSTGPAIVEPSLAVYWLSQRAGLASSNQTGQREIPK